MKLTLEKIKITMKTIMNKNNLEFRFAREAHLEEQSRVLSGKAITFETSSNDLGFWEVIHRGAITQELINQSDIVFCYNHDTSKVLARSYKNSGSLHVSLREDGVYFDFEIPDTTLGHDVYELVKRGDISHCSFAFTISDEPGSQKWTKRDGEMYREIYKIDGLYDLSCVTHEAYSDTSINARSLELRDEAEKTIDEEMEEKENDKTDESVVEEEVKEVEETREEESTEEEKTEESVEETPTEEEEEETRDESTDVEEEVEDKEEKEESDKSIEESRNSDINSIEKLNNNRTTMKKKFSLIDAINEVRSGKGFSEMNAQVNEKAIAEMRASGLNNFGDINLPIETRDALTVAAEGDDLVETEIYDVLGALRAKLVFSEAGAHFLNSLQGDVQIPIFSGNNVGWAAENGAAQDGAGAFSNVKLSPKRLTAYVDISNSLLVQANSDIEGLIYNDLIAAVADKLEKTILGSAAGSDTQPAGLLSTGLLTTTAATISDFEDLCEAEAQIENNNFFGEMKYIVSPSAKAKLRAMVKGANAGAGFVMQGGDIDGTPVLTTGNATGAIYGDWSQLYIGQWANISITVDKVTRAVYDQTRLVVNCYFDAVLARKNALVAETLA